MLKNISLGIYYPGNSLLHRLQARTKLLVLLWLVVFLVIANHREWHFAPYIVVGMLIIAATALSGISFAHMWQRLWLLVLLAFLGSIANIFFPSANDQALYAIGPFSISYMLLHGGILVYSILLALFILFLLLPIPVSRNFRQQRWLRYTRTPLVLLTLAALAILWFTRSASSSSFPVGPLLITRDGVWLEMTFFVVFLLLYALSLLLTMTTTPIALTEGLTILLTPLRWLRLPVDDFALMTLIALRFIPTLIEEIEQLTKAQTARGADLTRGTLRERVQSLAALFVPFIQGTLRRAGELATALEARGYQVDGHQTFLHEKPFGMVDYLVMGSVVLVTIGALFL